MTDLNLLKELLNKFNVVYEEEYCTNKTEIKVIAGYTFFFTAFYFDESGKFIEMGAWEE